jgi:hypothetical protein
MVLIFNLAAGAVGLLAIAAAAAAHFVGFDPYWLVAGFGAMTVIGGALELHPRPSWHPRYFWIMPAWLVGLAGTGLALRDAVDPVVGTVTLAAAGAAFIGVLVHAWLYKPGGKWLAGLVGAGAIVTSFQLVGYYRPEWKHPVLFAVNAAAMIAMVYFGVKLYQARKSPVP